MDIPNDWLPTAENINALPEPLRQFIYGIETNCDPALLMRENLMRKDENRALVAKIEQMEIAAAAQLPLRETPEMHDAVMVELYRGVPRTETNRLWLAYRPVLAAMIASPPPEPVASGAVTEFLPCPFCGSHDITAHDCDDDSFVKTLVASCARCGGTVESHLDWGPYSATMDRAGFDAAWKAKIAEAWNTRATPPAEPATAPSLTTCNCRWDGDNQQVQTCELHLAHLCAIHDWAERAKEAEAKLAAYPPLTAAEVHDLTCMQAGAPWMEPTLTALVECIAIYDKLRMDGKRPVDPADMPEDEQAAFWVTQQVPNVPEGYKLVMIPDDDPGDEPDWDEVKRQAEEVIGIKVEQNTFSIMVREVRRWLAHRACAPQATSPEQEPEGWLFDWCNPSRPHDVLTGYAYTESHAKANRVATNIRAVYKHSAPAPTQPAT